MYFLNNFFMSQFKVSMCFWNISSNFAVFDIAVWLVSEVKIYRNRGDFNVNGFFGVIFLIFVLSIFQIDNFILYYMLQKCSCLSSNPFKTFILTDAYSDGLFSIFAAWNFHEIKLKLFPTVINLLQWNT